MADIAVLTEGKYVAPTNADWYTKQVVLEDNLVCEAFESKGLVVEKLDWSSPDKDWSKYKAVIFRSVWDYFHRFDEFKQFLDSAEGKTRFVNPIPQIRWNMDKHYLLDLAQNNIPIVESHFIEMGDPRSLQQLHADYQLEKSVIKPCVSGAGRHTYLLTSSTIEQHEQVYRSVIQQESMILQPFQHLITEKGEVSHIVINGKHSHAVLKKAKAGDYRVQDDFGGTVQNYAANIEEIEFAESVARACQPLPLYARVDVIWDNNNEMVISEVELIEPELWFRECPKAANLLADAVINLL